MFLDRFNQLQEVVLQCIYTEKNGEITSQQAIRLFHSFLIRLKKKNGNVYVIGNGGSAGIASHFCVDLLNALQISASTLYDSNVMTCVSNDYGYEHVFSKPLGVLLRPNDLLVAISSSGESQNIINAVQLANRKKILTITLTGFSEKNPLRGCGNLNFWLDSKDYGLVETGHFFLLHTIIDSWKSDPFLLKQIASNDPSLAIPKD